MARRGGYRGAPPYRGVPPCRWRSECWSRPPRRGRHADARGRAGGGPRGGGAWRRHAHGGAPVRHRGRRSAGASARMRCGSPPTGGCTTGSVPSTGAHRPGRPWLNRMETALEMAPPGATDPADPARRHVNGCRRGGRGVGGDRNGCGRWRIPRTSGGPRGCGGADGGDGRGWRSRRGRARAVTADLVVGAAVGGSAGGPAG